MCNSKTALYLKIIKIMQLVNFASFLRLETKTIFAPCMDIWNLASKQGIINCLACKLGCIVYTGLICRSFPIMYIANKGNCLSPVILKKYKCVQFVIRDGNSLAKNANMTINIIIYFPQWGVFWYHKKVQTPIFMICIACDNCI